MKPGSGDSDPFADEEGEDEEESVENALDELDDVDETVSDESTSRDRLPWIYRRESVQDGRVKTVQLHLQNDAATSDREERAQLQQQTGEDLKKADFREAVFRAGLDNMDEAVQTLREWGYDFSEK